MFNLPSWCRWYFLAVLNHHRKYILFIWSLLAVIEMDFSFENLISDQISFKVRNSYGLKRVHLQFQLSIVKYYVGCGKIQWVVFIWAKVLKFLLDIQLEQLYIIIFNINTSSIMSSSLINLFWDTYRLH